MEQKNQVEINDSDFLGGRIFEWFLIMCLLDQQLIGEGFQGALSNSAAIAGPCSTEVVQG